MYQCSESLVTDDGSDDKLQRIDVAGQLWDSYSNSIHLNQTIVIVGLGLNTWLLGAPKQWLSMGRLGSVQGFIGSTHE